MATIRLGDAVGGGDDAVPDQKIENFLIFHAHGLGISLLIPPLAILTEGVNWDG